MKVDDATDEPINECYACGKEVVGYVDNPEIEDYVDYLSKSNEMWRKSQEDIAYLILDKIQNLKKISEVKPNSSHD